MYKKKKNIKKICHTLYKIYLYCLKCIKGVYTGSYEQFGEKMYTMWFGMYERSSGHLSSSGFEHVFIGKLQKNYVYPQILHEIFQNVILRKFEKKKNLTEKIMCFMQW